MVAVTSQDDNALVTLAANQLDVGEFELFRIAYRAWHGVDELEHVVDRHFGDYLVSGRAPHWARHFCRDTLEKSRADGRDVVTMLWRPSFAAQRPAEAEAGFSLAA